MIENLETLVTLSKSGTMIETSTVLKISQSAVSKRIATLERYYDRQLIERHGRRVVLTHHGTRLVEKVTPLISELRSVFLEDNALPKGKIVPVPFTCDVAVGNRVPWTGDRHDFMRRLRAEMTHLRREGHFSAWE